MAAARRGNRLHRGGNAHVRCAAGIFLTVLGLTTTTESFTLFRLREFAL